MTWRNNYQLGWDDGYAEGYGAKLVDVTEQFMPAGADSEIEAGADYLMSKRAGLSKADAIGLVRGIFRAARKSPTPSRAERRAPDAAVLTALRAVMGLSSVQTLFEAAEEYPHGQEDVAAELSALNLARAALAALPRPEADEGAVAAADLGQHEREGLRWIATHGNPYRSGDPARPWWTTLVELKRLGLVDADNNLTDAGRAALAAAQEGS